MSVMEYLEGEREEVYRTKERTLLEDIKMMEETTNKFIKELEKLIKEREENYYEK